VRRLTGLFRRSRRFSRPLELTDRDVRSPSARPSANDRSRPDPDDLKALYSEVEQVAGYVARLRREIGGLRPRTLFQDQLPNVREELASVRGETQAAVERIMATAETLLSGAGHYSEAAMDILDACTFQDLVGQRLSRASALLGEIEKRIERFARAANIPDAAESFDRDRIVREARREVLLVEGPQAAGEAIDQDSIDKLFG
jgi:chemotaxis protein CheZ